VTCNADGQALGVFTLNLTHFLAKTIFFQRVWGVYRILEEILEGWGGFLWSKNGNSGKEGKPT